MAGATTAATTQTTTSHVPAKTTRKFPPFLVPVAVLLAVAVGLLSLLPSLAQAVWEVPHLFVLGLVISYGVFTQRNTDDVEKTAGDGNGTNNKVGAEALSSWNARYRPDEPLIVVADHATASDSAREGAMERPLSLPVRRLKPPVTQESADTGDVSTDVVAGEETDDSSASSSAGFRAVAHTAPSPPSVLDADLGLSPCSQPQSSPFFAHSGAAESGGLSGYHPCMAREETSLSEDVDGEITDWDDEEASDWDEEEVDGSADEMTMSSERSARGDFVTTCANGPNDDMPTVDEELLKLAAKAAPEGEDEVDRKANEFIAKFREQIRLQRL